VPSSNDGSEESVEPQTPFDRKANWLALKEHLLEVLEDWPVKDLSYLGDRLFTFAERYCPQNEGAASTQNSQ
jgi:hypothetical protein